MIKRRATRTVAMGKVRIGSKYPVSIQSMTKTDTADITATVAQIKQLEKAGCEIIRLAVKDKPAASALKKIKSKINIPLVADIHFNYRLALEAIQAGVDGLRLNPGNIYRKEEVKAVAQAASKRKIPIRVGINSGSLPFTKYHSPFTNLADSMAKSAINYIKMLESLNFYDIIISLKAADVAATVTAYRKVAGMCDYPLHLGVTATGLPEDGAIKSAIGIGGLLLDGIGDTIRVSLAGSPEEEVKVGREILQSLNLRSFGPELIVCPTCGRCQTDVIKIAREVRKKMNCLLSTVNCQLPPKVAIMGCEVNGPGEAKGADIGVACGKKSALLFKKGKIIKKISENQIVNTLMKEFRDALE